MSTPYQAFKTPLHAQRFLSKIAIQADPKACWPWTAGCSWYGYGMFWDGWANVQAHKKMAEWTRCRAIDPKLHVRHLCHNRLCCNPTHLEIGTAAENSADSVRAGRTGGTARKAAVHLTEAQIAEMRRRYEVGLLDPTQRLTHYDLMVTYGISRTTVIQLLKGCRRR